MKERTSSLPDLCDILIVIVYRSYLDPYSKKMKQCKIKSETWTVIKTCDAIMELWNKIDHIMKIVTGRWVHGSSLHYFLYWHRCLKIYFANLKISYFKINFLKNHFGVISSGPDNRMPLCCASEETWTCHVCFVCSCWMVRLIDFLKLLVPGGGGHVLFDFES